MRQCECLLPVRFFKHADIGAGMRTMWAFRRTSSLETIFSVLIADPRSA